MQLLQQRRDSFQTNLTEYIHIMDHGQPVHLIDAGGLVNGAPEADITKFTCDNRKAWDAIASDWEIAQTPENNGKTDDGNDMFTQCLLPQVKLLADWQSGQNVLDLGAGSGIIARLFARLGAHVTGLDFSEKMLQKGRERAQQENLGDRIHYDLIDLMDSQNMADYMARRKDMYMCLGSMFREFANIAQKGSRGQIRHHHD